jgi:alginate O-acetyltransferase complex protein AlgI
MFVLVMLLSIAGNWAFGLLIDHYREYCRTAKILLTTMLLFNFGILFIFKYLVFTLININDFFGTHFFIPSIVLPIGISFFTFQAVSYVLDVYRKDTEVQRNILHTGLYIALFPQLIAGPIVRYKTVANQIMNRRENFSDFSAGCCRFIGGFAKKMLLANSFAVVADKAFSMPVSEMSVFFAWLGALAYTFQIYYDFSGYSDMAIGLGKMFGFHFPENFNHPYVALSVSDFWRRWHISLSSWFRDYVYFPMGGSRVKTKSRLVFNLLTVWCLTGIWHGANWTFFFWGFFYFVLLTVEKLTNFDRRLRQNGNLDNLKGGGGGQFCLNMLRSSFAAAM